MSGICSIEKDEGIQKLPMSVMSIGERADGPHMVMIDKIKGD